MILNPYIPQMFRSDHPIKSYNSLHISHRPGAFEPPRLIFYLNAFPSDQYWSIDHYLQIGTVNETFASIWNDWKKIHIFPIGQRGFSSPPLFIFYLHAFSSDEYWSTDHYLQIGSENETFTSTWNDWRKMHRHVPPLFTFQALEPITGYRKDKR